KPNRTFPHILGSDFAGEVDEIDPEAGVPFAPGQRVTAWWVVPCWRCEQCAAFPTAFGCAWHMLVTKAELRPGETVLIHAASSGVSTAAIQVAKAVGAYVYATGSADWKLERARAIGADETINYATEDFQVEIMKRTAKRGVDVVFEHVGGDVWEKSIRSLTRGGRLVTTGGTAAYDVKMNVAYVFHKELKLLGANSTTKRELDVQMPLIAAGRLTPVVDRVFPL